MGEISNDSELRKRIKESLIVKSNAKQRATDATSKAFREIKKILHEMDSDLNEELYEHLLDGVKIEYRDKGSFEAHFLIANDVLVFNMHSNAFDFGEGHPINRCGLVKKDPNASYCGVINVYNCLADSLKHSRNEDQAYLIGRLFVNYDNFYFLEGEFVDDTKCEPFTQGEIDREALTDIVERLINYALDLDLLAPPYDSIKNIKVEQLNSKNEHLKMITGKRVGTNEK